MQKRRKERFLRTSNFGVCCWLFLSDGAVSVTMRRFFFFFFFFFFFD